MAVVDGRINDLRILHLALGVEESLERLQAGLARHLRDTTAQRAAEASQTEGPAHHELRAAYEALNSELAGLEPQPDDVALLEALYEGERQARSFYQEWRDRLADPALAALFDRMAAEEQGHVELIATQLARLRPLS